MSSTDADSETEQDAEVVDEARTALLEGVRADLGDAVADSHLIPGRDLWVRISAEAWGDTASYLRGRQRFRFFDWLSAVDWLPSPYGRSLDAEVDKMVGADASSEEAADVDGPSAADAVAASFAGGSTRFQVLARVHSLSTGLGLTVKADLGDDPDALSVATWTGVYPGADWHEREAWEMFGITFEGHPGLRHLYLPSGFEGHPLRKDYPLLSRLVKPWPGIVDVEPMPEVEDTTNPEGSQ